MDWNDLKFFLAVANAKSLSAAARYLNVSVSTVSRRIAALEDSLDLKLFRHHRDGYELTGAGADLVPTAENAAAQISVLERTAADKQGDISGDVRLDAPELLSQHILLPNLEPLTQSHPAIRLDIRSSVRPVRLGSQESDIVLRLVRPERGNYKIRTAGIVGCGLYAAPAFTDRFGQPATGAGLADFRLIGWNDDLRFLAMALWLEELCPDIKPALRLNSFSAQLEAARHGLGVAVLPCFAAEQAGLVRMLPDMPGLDLDLWMLVQEQTASLPRVQAVSEYLHRLLGENRQILQFGHREK